jgi:hypothetical protein
VIIDSTEFLSAMKLKWAEYGNVCSGALEHVWLQMQATLDYQSGPDALDVWPVIPCELGSGKTTAAKVWCAVKPFDEHHPGVLIVVRTKDQADEYARDINAWSGVPSMALAHHSGRPLADRQNLDVLPSYPVLVVCHKSYENGLDDFAVDVSRIKFEKMHQFRRSQRGLVIIDESLDQVHEERIRRDVLKELMARMPRAVEKAHPEAMRVIESINRVLREAPDERHRTLATEELLVLTPFTADQADAYLLAMWEQGLRSAKRVEPELRARLGQTLSALRRHLGAYRWTAGNGSRTALSGHRLLLLPPGTHGVVFDATARLNNVYTGRPAEFDVRHTTQVRDYSTVTIYAARTSGTGKTTAKMKGEKLATDTLAALTAHYGDRVSERRVLIVVAKDGEEHFLKAGASAGFKDFAVAHWNKIDGRNDWRDYDTLVIATLPYATASLDLNTYMAVHEKELDDAALNAPPDEVKLVRENRIAAQLAQAMGRIRLRTMTRKDGACEPCDIFLRLPNWRFMVDADRIVDAVKRTLPGAAVVPWERATRKLPRAAKRTGARYDPAFVELVRGMADGARMTSDQIRAHLQIKGKNAWARMARSARTEGNALHQTMAELGARISEVTTEQGVTLVVTKGPMLETASPARRGNTRETALIERLGRLAPGGRLLAVEAQAQVGIPQGSWAKMLGRSTVKQAMADLGITYQTGAGGRSRSAFERASGR